MHAADGHPTLAAMPEIDDDKLDIVDQDFRDRLGVLLSIDDLVSEVRCMTWRGMVWHDTCSSRFDGIGLGLVSRRCFFSQSHPMIAESLVCLTWLILGG